MRSFLNPQTLAQLLDLLVPGIHIANNKQLVLISTRRKNLPQNTLPHPSVGSIRGQMHGCDNERLC